MGMLFAYITLIVNVLSKSTTKKSKNIKSNAESSIEKQRLMLGSLFHEKDKVADSKISNGNLLTNLKNLQKESEQFLKKGSSEIKNKSLVIKKSEKDEDSSSSSSKNEAKESVDMSPKDSKKNDDEPKANMDEFSDLSVGGSKNNYKSKTERETRKNLRSPKPIQLISEFKDSELENNLNQKPEIKIPQNDLKNKSNEVLKKDGKDEKIVDKDEKAEVKDTDEKEDKSETKASRKPEKEDKSETKTPKKSEKKDKSENKKSEKDEEKDKSENKKSEKSEKDEKDEEKDD